MKPRRLMIAALLLVGVSAALWWSNKQEASKDKASSPDDPPKILEIPQDQIEKIEIGRMGADPVVLAKGGDTWKIQTPRNLPADQDAVNALVATLAVMPSERLVDEKPGDLAPYGLKTPILKLKVTRKDGKTHTLFVGDDAPSGAAAYARIDGDLRLFTIPTSTRTSLEKTWRDLRDKHLLPFDSEKATRVELTAKGSTIELARGDANAWTIVKPKTVRADNFAAEDLLRRLKDARMEVTNDTEEEASFATKFASGTPVGTAKVTDPKGTWQVEVRKSKENDYYAKSSAVDGVFKTTTELGEGLNKNLDDLRNKKPFAFGLNDPAQVEIKQDGTTYLFTKSGSDWKRDGKTVEPGSVQQVLDRLRDLTAVRFAESVTGTPAAEYTVGSEKVTVNKQGDTYLARRGNEAEVYVLDSKAVSEIKDLAAAAKELPPPPAKK